MRVVFITSFFSMICIAAGEIFMEDVKYNFNPKDIFVKIDRVKDHGGYIFNITLDFLKDYKTIMLTMSLAIESQANSGKFDNFLINTKINVCRLGAGSYNFMQKYVYMVTQKYSNIKMVCPFPKNSYYLKNVEFHDSDIPPIFPDTKAQITVASSGIIVGKKRLQEIFTMQTVAQFMKG